MSETTSSETAGLKPADDTQKPQDYQSSFAGSELTADEVQDRKLVIVEVKETTMGDFPALLFVAHDFDTQDDLSFVSTSKVLREQIEKKKAEGGFPINARVKKQKNYYTFY